MQGEKQPTIATCKNDESYNSLECQTQEYIWFLFYEEKEVKLIRGDKSA